KRTITLSHKSGLHGTAELLYDVHASIVSVIITRSENEELSASPKTSQSSLDFGRTGIRLFICRRSVMGSQYRCLLSHLGSDHPWEICAGMGASGNRQKYNDDRFG